MITSRSFSRFVSCTSMKWLSSSSHHRWPSLCTVPGHNASDVWNRIHATPSTTVLLNVKIAHKVQEIRFCSDKKYQIFKILYQASNAGDSQLIEMKAGICILTAQIQVRKGCGDLSKMTQSCNWCKRAFYKVLNKAFEYYMNIRFQI